MSITLQVVKFLVFVTSTLGYVGALRRYLNVKPVAAPFVTFCSIICVLYVFSLLGLLQLGAYVIFAVGLLLAAFWYAGLRRNLEQKNFDAASVAPYIPVAVLYLAPVVFFSWIIPPDFYLHENDEYSHWALSTKVIASTNALFQADSGVAFKSYPPGTSLFHYYVVKLFGYSEARVLLAHIVLILSGLAAVFASILDRRPLYCAFAYFASITFVSLFDYSFYTIYVDALLGVAFAAALVLTLDYQYTKTNLFILVVLSCTLILLKPIGLVFAAIACTAYFAQRLVAGALFWVKHYRADERKEARRFLLGYAKLSALYVLITASVLSFFFFSWRAYVTLIGGTVAADVPGFSYFFLPECGRVLLTLQEFESRIHSPSFLRLSIGKEVFGVSLVSLTGVLLVMNSLAVFFSRGKERVQTASLFGVCVTGAVVYFGFLLFAYIAFFSNYESIRLASFERYAGTFYLAWLLITCAVSINVLLGHRVSRKQLVGAYLLLALTFAISPQRFKDEVRSAPSDIGNRDLRNKIKRLADLALSHAKKGDAAYYIGQASKGYDFLMFRYLAAPLSRGQTWCWSLGDKYYDDDLWTCPESIVKVVPGYELLVIGNADEQFWRHNQRYFDPEDRLLKEGVFRINTTKDGIIRFARVKN
jgi:hypothetical protein